MSRLSRIMLVTALALCMLVAGVRACLAEAPDQPAAGSVVIALMPAALTVQAGQVFTLTVQSQAGAQSVDGARASLDFNPAYLGIQQITAGGALPLVLTNKFSNSAGSADFAAGALNSFPGGSFTLAQVRFVAVSATAGASVAFNSIQETTPGSARHRTSGLPVPTRFSYR